MSVACKRLPCPIGAERESQDQAPEKGLLPQKLGHAVAHAEGGLVEHVVRGYTPACVFVGCPVMYDPWR